MDRITIQPRAIRISFLLTAVLLVSALLVGCGQKGGLTRPEASEPLRITHGSF